ANSSPPAVEQEHRSPLRALPVDTGTAASGPGLPPICRLSSGRPRERLRRTAGVPITYQYETLATLRERAKAEVGKVVVGQGRAVELLLIAAMARGHVLLEGPPGTAKTLLGRATAYVLGADFNRVQVTADTTPSEPVGLRITRAGETKFIEGTIFTNV